MSRPRLLDLFCGAGGCSVGYERAGFDVVGVDISPQPHYPPEFEFVQADAVDVASRLSQVGSQAIMVNAWSKFGRFDAVHASPPCQDWSSLASVSGGDGTGWMLDATLDALRRRVRVPWVVENVPGAPLVTSSNLFGEHGVELCGTMFGLQVLRHRLFQSSIPLLAPEHGSHDGDFYSPAGHGDPNWRHRASNPLFHGKGYHARCSEAMGIDWMNRDELSQAIPPAYTEFIGTQLMASLSAEVL